MPFAQLTRLLGHVVNFCYPGICAVCNANSDGAAILCSDCDGRLDALCAAPACDRCALPLATVGSPCPRCGNKGLSPLKHIARLGVYDDPLRTLIHDMKFHHRWNIAELLADHIAEQPLAGKLLNNTDAILPIPLHFRRHFTRGYNQAELIARRLARRFKLRLCLDAARIRDTAAQTSIRSRTVRAENVRDAFALLDEKHLRGHRLLLIDDVMTTGATLRSFARVLVEASPASISAIVVAVADPRGRDFEAI